MDITSNPQTEVIEKTWLVSIPLRPGACTVVDWVSSAVTEEKDNAENDKQERASEQASESEDSDDDDDDDGGGGGYASGTTALPPAIANDPFFARLLKNAELRDAQDRKKAAKKRQSKRRTKDAVEDNYDLDDPFIDDSELTFMDGHNHAKTQQRKKRRKRDEGNMTETEDQRLNGHTVSESASAEKRGKSNDEDEDDLAVSALDDIDKYEDDDFFVYFGPLNEIIENSAEDDAFEAPTKKTRSRRQPEKKQHQQQQQQQQNGAVKDNAQSRRKYNGTTGSKSESVDQPARKNADSRSQQSQQQASSSSSHEHQQQKAKAQSNGSGAIPSATAISDTAAAATTTINAANTAPTASQIPSNGRKSGSRTSRKLDQTAKTLADSSSASWRPPVPGRDKKQSEQLARSDVVENASVANAMSAAVIASIGNESAASKPGYKRSGTPSASVGTSSISIAPEDVQATNDARRPTPEIEAALEELLQATKKEAFSNRQRFPSSLKPPLRQVCELSMACALEYDSNILALSTSEHQVFAWSTPLDIVGFTLGIYHRLADILPYNRATVRKIVSKLLSGELINWKERQLKQIEEGLKARIDDQIERGLGWIPVGPRSSNKEDGNGDGSGGGAQVRWHWTTISKHILYQYMVLTLNINELRNQLDQGPGKDGSYREQQARKDAYAHLVNLWPGSSMSTYEISRAYSSRKTLLEKQTKRAEATPPAQSQTHNAEASAGAAAAASKSDIALQLHPGYGQSVSDMPEKSIIYESAPSSSTVKQSLEYSLSQQQIAFAPPSALPASSARDAFSYTQQTGFNEFSRSPGVQSEAKYPSPTSLRQSVLADFSRDTASDQDPAQSHMQLPHRNLTFESRSPPLSLDQQVRSRVYSYYNGDIQQQQSLQPHQQHPAQSPLQFQDRPQTQHQHQHEHEHEHEQSQPQPQMQPQSQSPSSRDEDYASPNSSRYSMSVKNLTSP